MRPLMVGPQDAADALGISKTRVYQLMARKELRSAKVGKVRRIFTESLDEYVAKLQAVS